MSNRRWPGPTSCALYMRSTILSDHQYEAKFVPTANRKPMNIPPTPPSACPMNMSSALIVPSSSAVFTILFIVSFYPRDQTGDEGGATRQRADLDVFVKSMRAVADGAEAVKRRNPERGGEIPVR